MNYTMKNISLLLIALALISCNNRSAENSDQENEANQETIDVKEVEKLAGNFSFTEGPAVDSKGNVYFTDIPNHLILIWTIEDQLDTFRVKSGRANGLYFDCGNAT